MPILGTSSIGGSTVGPNTDVKRTNPVTMPCDGYAVSMSVYADGKAAGVGNQVMKGVIYDDDGAAGAPGTLLGQTTEVTVVDNQDAAWMVGTFSSPLWLAAGNYYQGWITGTVDASAQHYYTAAGTDYYNSDTYAGGPADPFGAASTRTRTYSYYVTFNINPSAALTATASILAPTVTATSSLIYLGNTTPFASTGTQSANEKQCIRVQATDSGTVVALYAYFDGSGGGLGSQVFKGVIYSDNAGAPDALLATGSEFTVAQAAAAAWKTSTISLSIVKNAYYWIGIIKGTTTQVGRWYCETVASSSQKNSDTYSDGPSDPFGTPTASNNNYNVYIVASPKTNVTTTVTDALKTTNAGLNIPTVSATRNRTVVLGDALKTLNTGLVTPTIPAWLGSRWFGCIDVLTSTATSTGIKRAIKYQLTEDGNITGVYIYLSGGAGACNLKLAIYDDDGTAGAAGTRLAVSDEIDISASQGASWVPWILASPLSLTAGWYWFALHSDVSFNYYRNATTGSTTRMYNSEAYNATTSPSNPFGAPTLTEANWDFSMYATYYLPSVPCTVNPLDAFKTTNAGLVIPSVSAVIKVPTLSIGLHFPHLDIGLDY